MNNNFPTGNKYLTLAKNLLLALLMLVLMVGLVVPERMIDLAHHWGLAEDQIANPVTQSSRLPEYNSPVVTVSAKPRPTTITLAAVGDVMGHTPQLKAAWDAERNTYDFVPMLAPIASIISGADLAVANLETTLAGSKTGYSGYPCFNSPDALADALLKTGFDLVSTANNHCLDRKETGVLRTIAVLDKLGLAHTGTFATPQQRVEPLIKNVKGIKLGFLSYTYGTNGFTVPRGKDYLVNYAELAHMKEDIVRLKQSDVDLTIILLHFGNEYQRNPTPAQEQLVDDLIQTGADLIIGSHPHVLQPIQQREVRTKEKSAQGWVAFSLGNFFSNQREPYTDTGAILEIQITKDWDANQTEIDSVQFTPTWVAKYTKAGRTNFESAPIAYLLKEGKAKPYMSAANIAYLTGVLEQTNTHLASRLDTTSIPVLANN